MSLAAALALSLVVVVVAPSFPLAQAAPATQTTAAAEEAAILAVIDRFMHAISNNDDAALAAIRIEGAMNTVARANGMVTRRAFQPRANATGGGENRERYWDPVVHVRGNLAMVWTPYEFWVKGKTSHCGIDAFELVKEQGTWRIGNAMWTVEPDACAALRPSDPSRIRPK
jgi:hypothetical protein